MARGQMSKLRAKAGGNEGDMNPKQLKEQAAKLRKLTPSAIRRTFPQMKDMSDAMIAAVRTFHCSSPILILDLLGPVKSSPLAGIIARSRRPLHSLHVNSPGCLRHTCLCAHIH